MGKHTMTRHHKKCRSNGGTDDWSNLSYVPQIQHRAWHTLFKNDKPEEIVRQINSMWLDPAYELVLKPRELK